MNRDAMSTFAQKINSFNANLSFREPLPGGIGLMNPFKENDCATPASRAFYQKYYGDSAPRYAILGINPGRFGAGITGVPFTDPVRLAEKCDIHIPGCPHAHEPSSVFVYEVIAAYGSVTDFYASWYINSVCPLGFTRQNAQGRHVNYNYYDSAALKQAATPFIVQTLKEQIACGLDRRICFCFGMDKNYKFLNALNQEHNFFQQIIPLDHPRYIVQYRHSQMKEYAARYARLFRRAIQE